MLKKQVYRSLSLVFSMLLLFSSCIFVNAEEKIKVSSIQTPELLSTIEYVPVTNLDQLIDLAVKQYEENSSQVVMRNSLGDEQETELVAKQLIKKEKYADGSVVRTYANTGLLVLDDEGKKLSAQETVQVHHKANGSWGINVYGTMDFLTEEYTTGNGLLVDIYVRGISVTASAGYGSSEKVTKIHLRYNAVDDMYFETNREQPFFNPGSQECILWCVDNKFHRILYPGMGGVSATATFYTSASQYQLIINLNDVHE